MQTTDWLRVPSALYWIIPTALAVSAALAVAGWRRYRSTRSQIGRMIRAASRAWLQDIVLPDGLDGQIHLDYLLLTDQGLVVLDIRDVPGAIFGAERMTDWTVINGNRRFTFRNPLGPLDERISAVKLLARSVPVMGRVVFTDHGDFPKGIPPRVSRLGQVREDLGLEKSSRSGIDTEMEQAWSRITEAMHQVPPAAEAGGGVTLRS